jgi:group II intron reverse transcriptase/maturase
VEQATIQGIRESRMQGEGLQIRDAETDAETVNNRLVMINVAEEMKHLYELAKRDPGKRFIKLWNKLISVEWLAQAWEQIRRNKGKGTPGIDKMTDEAIDLELIEKLAERLKRGAYRPKPVRRVYIPKTNGKVRPLGIPTLEDRIIQQGLRMLLEPIFEADFHNCSHGFRQGRSTITALRDVAIHYPHSSWIIEGDIKGCFDTIPHGKLVEQISRRVADEKIPQLCWKFLKAGYLEQWSYHRTYSGTPQGGIISPLFANIFLHQLDEFLDDELKSNILQSAKDVKARRNPEYCQIDDKITKLRRKLKGKRTEDRRSVIEQIQELEKQRRRIPSYAKDIRHPGKLWYTRYADDFVILVAGNKSETETIKEQVKSRLSAMNLILSDEKTRITHWSKKIQFLGYQIHGKQKTRKVGLRAVLSIPLEKQQQIFKRIENVCGYYHIPKIDVLTQVNAMFRGWCNYFKYANQPVRIFKKLGSLTWWAYAHYNARKHKSSIKKMLICETKAGRYKRIQKSGRVRTTFLENVGKKSVILDIFPPNRAQIRSFGNKPEWRVDLQPVKLMNWASGRSLMTRLTAIERAKGVCERCRENPVHQVHHNRPLRGKSFLARVQSDRSQRETADALCKECHLEAHQGSFRPKKVIPNWNAGCAERCLSGVVSAS